MKWSLENIALCRLGNCSIAPQVSEPFAVDWVREMAKAPIVSKGMHAFVLGFTGECPSEQGCNYGFTVRPPKFHVMPVFLYGKIVQVTEVEQPAKFGVPTARPHPVKYFEAYFYVHIFISEGAFMHYEPGAFQGMAWV